MPPQDSMYDVPDRQDETPAFAASPPSVPPVTTPTITTSLTPPTPPPARKCEGCATPHAGTYGSGRFCSATCAKKVGARHKWATRASANLPRRPTARHALADSPCESCRKMHDKSYGSGRFCSVHCARRVAATRKWEKSRSEKNKRLEAIRPAMLAPPPAPCPLPMLSGKKRRLVGRHLEQMTISDTPAFYVSPQTYVPHRLEVPPTHLSNQPQSSSPVLSVPPSIHPQTYLPAPPVHYSQVNQMETVQQPILYTSDTRPAQQMCYGYPGIPAYSVHPAHSPVDTTSYSATSPSPSQSPSPLPQRSVHYPQMPVLQRQLAPNYVIANGPAFEMETVSATASPARIDDPALAYAQHPMHIQQALKAPVRKEKQNETSESAARALLCLRETN